MTIHKSESQRTRYEHGLDRRTREERVCFLQRRHCHVFPTAKGIVLRKRCTEGGNRTLARGSPRQICHLDVTSSTTQCLRRFSQRHAICLESKSLNLGADCCYRDLWAKVHYPQGKASPRPPWYPPCLSENCRESSFLFLSKASV